MVKNPLALLGDVGAELSIPGSGRSPGGGNSNLFQYSCLENPGKTEILSNPGQRSSSPSTCLNHQSLTKAKFVPFSLSHKCLRFPPCLHVRG